MNIDEGDIYGFLGPNGAGKTTTIRMLTGLLKPTMGDISIGGFDIIKNNQDIKKIIGVLPESHGYYNWMTAYEYLEYFYELFGMNESNSEQHINYLLEKVGLQERRHTLIGQFSRGMRQRLGLAKTLINKPKIIFLDEPTLGLDPTGQRDIHELILELNRTMNITVFITSHLLKDIEVLCNKVAIVKNGELIVEESIEQLQQLYSDEESVLLKTSDNNKAFKIIHKQLPNLIAEIVNNDIKIFIAENEDMRIMKQKIIEALFMEHIDIMEIVKQKSTIEDVFIKLVTSDDIKAVK